MNFNETTQTKGHLEVWKHYPDGTKELHYDAENVICSGMGATLAEFFDAAETEAVNNFQIVYFQVGTDGWESSDANDCGTAPTPCNRGTATGASSLGHVSGALTTSQYGTGNLQVVEHDLLASGVTTNSQSFGVIPHSYIKRVSERKCMWQVVLDEQTANDLTLNEIGLFSKNPLRALPDKSMMCAYRYFDPIAKTSSFILVFRWTIEF
jgi:hypothetical protein